MRTAVHGGGLLVGIGFLYHVGPRDCIQVSRLGDKYLHPQSHLVGFHLGVLSHSLAM